MNRPASRFQRSMHHLALIAMVLMVCMPLLSRWQQSLAHAQDRHPDMCLSDASRLALDAQAVHVHHPADDNTPAPHDHSHDHEACGYCTLATRMLPVLALALVLPVPAPTRHSPQRSLPAPPTAPRWPAHHPRGPPLPS